MRSSRSRGSWSELAFYGAIGAAFGVASSLAVYALLSSTRKTTSPATSGFPLRMRPASLAVRSPVQVHPGPSPSAPTTPVGQLRGTNLTGGESPWSSWPATGPVDGQNYQFVGTRDIDYLLSKGCNFFRLLFTWEAVQPQPMSAIPSSQGVYATYWQRFKAVVDYATSKGATVLIDVHGGDDSTFAAYRGVKVGGSYGGYAVSDMLADLWGKLAAIFKGNSRVLFGATNEPSNLPTMTWFSCAQKIVNAIRAAGAGNPIVMPGAYYDGAGSWTTGWGDQTNAYGWENANGVGRALVDPLQNTWVQVHLYFDPDAGGTTTDIQSTTIASERLADVTTWARSRGLKVLVGEVGLSAGNPLAASAWSNLMSYVSANADVVRGFAWWTYGVPSWWGQYPFTLSPNASYTKDSAQMTLIAPSLCVR